MRALIRLGLGSQFENFMAIMTGTYVTIITVALKPKGHIARSLQWIKSVSPPHK